MTGKQEIITFLAKKLGAKASEIEALLNTIGGETTKLYQILVKEVMFYDILDFVATFFAIAFISSGVLCVGLIIYRLVAHYEFSDAYFGTDELTDRAKNLRSTWSKAMKIACISLIVAIAVLILCKVLSWVFAPNINMFKYFF